MSSFKSYLDYRIHRIYCNLFFRNVSKFQSCCLQLKSFSSIENDSIKKIPKTESLWKASSTAIRKQSLAKEQEQLMRSFLLDSDFSQIKEEMVLFKIENQAQYRRYFYLIIANFLFWTICARSLYKFYTKLEDLQQLQERRKNYEEKKKDMKFLRRFLEYFRNYGVYHLIDYTIILLATAITLLLLVALSRCVSFIHLMPGGKQVKIGLIKWTGQIDPNRYHLFDLKDVSARKHRLDPGSMIRLDVRKQSVMFIDRYGKFPNEAIYDMSIGISRNVRS
ncbi:hypothetical protein SSS_06789 [Sarcoptes scabiei]|uniref:Uncharacterized protein n=2 Tax=Sarcoptes scabiei TaxID=52283 RepID=A0A834RHJ5_SARSC|nr:hypothetical protein SSS_06789 [Sarcoptes scabiei]